jgi:hypothetical protein
LDIELKFAFLISSTHTLPFDETSSKWHSTFLLHGFPSKQTDFLRSPRLDLRTFVLQPVKFYKGAVNRFQTLGKAGRMENWLK